MKRKRKEQSERKKGEKWMNGIDYGINHWKEFDEENRLKELIEGN